MNFRCFAMDKTVLGGYIRDSLQTDQNVTSQANYPREA
jgi:hypothetical protein